MQEQQAQDFLYGGQAVLEGVMFRGQRNCALAVRTPSGDITTTHRSVSSQVNRWRRLPFLRGIILVIESVTLGLWAFQLSESLSKGETGRVGSRAIQAAKVLASLGIAMALFVLLPFLIVDALTDSLAVTWQKSLVEGGLRLALLALYALVIGRFRPIQRVFGYHGAEHMVARAHQEGQPLTVGSARAFSTRLPWCGTTVLLMVAMVATLIFPLFSDLSRTTALAARILVTPILAGISLEILFIGDPSKANKFASLVAAPGLLLQRLTTASPSDEQIEVALQALKAAIAKDKEAMGAT